MSDEQGDPSPTPADLFNTPVEFDFKGTKYRGRKLTNDEIGEFCTWLEGRAMEAAWLRSENLPAAARDVILKAAIASIAAGMYQTGGQVFLDVTLFNPTAAAGAYQLYLTLRNEHPDLTLDDCSEMYMAEASRRAVENLRRGTLDSKPSGGRKGSSGPSGKSSRSSRKKGSGRKKRGG
jgi:hypothetical protein